MRNYTNKLTTAIVFCNDKGRERVLKYRNIKFSEIPFNRFIKFIQSRPYIVSAVNIYDKESKSFIQQIKDLT